MKKGTRHYPHEVTGHLLLPEGGYGKDKRGVWHARPPGQHMGCLKNHDVTEHEDGTITVSPSIEIGDNQSVWHGFLEKGIWREA